MPIYKGLQWWLRQSGTDRNSTYTDAGSAKFFMTWSQDEREQSTDEAFEIIDASRRGRPRALPRSLQPRYLL